MNQGTESRANGRFRRRALEAGAWAALIALLWGLDTLTKLAVRERTGVGLDDFRLFAEQATSAAAALVMVAFLLGGRLTRRGAGTPVRPPAD